MFLKRPEHSIDYRADIDGLRAIAVLAVLGYHFFPNLFRGGFTGVDIFFVISGYLITSLILTKAENDNFSFIEFYSRRIVRIFPSLLIVLLFVLSLGWFSLLDIEYAQLGKHVASGAGFFSNFVFLNEFNYFDTDATTKPLLHLWSLSIEEQFYIFWPILLWIGRKKKNYSLFIIMSFMMTSFIYGVTKTFDDHITSFYLPQSRAWELMVGGFIAWLSIYKKNSTHLTEKISNMISCIGVFLLGLGVFAIKKNDFFPAGWALIPVTGASLLLLFGHKSFFNKVLSNNFLVIIGLISFSLYLWHWPLYSMARIIEGHEPRLLAKTLIIFISFALAFITYRCIELPMRKRVVIRKKALALILSMIIVGGAGHYVYISNGFSDRNIMKINNFEDRGDDGGYRVTLDPNCGIDWERRKEVSICQQDPREVPIYALIGDSKAANLFGGLVRTSIPNHRWLMIGGYGAEGGVVPVISKSPLFESYQKRNDLTFKSLIANKNIKVVTYALSKTSLFNFKNEVDDHEYEVSKAGVIQSIRILLDAGKKVVIIVDNPSMPSQEDCLGRITDLDFINKIFSQRSPKCKITIDEHLATNKKYRQLLNDVVGTFKESVYLFDPTHLYCDQETKQCSFYDPKSGRVLYSKKGYLSDFGTGLVGEELNPFLKTL